MLQDQLAHARVNLRFQIAVRDGLGQRLDQPERLETGDRRPYRRRCQAGAARHLALGNSGKRQTQTSLATRIATLSAGIDPLLGKGQRTDPSHSQHRSPKSASPGRRHPGMVGGAAPKSAALESARVTEG